MTGHSLFVFGAAGAGKTTFCRNLREYCSPKRSIKSINLDPAQEEATDFDLDLCDFITVGEVMDELDFGPNGALFYALQEMSENLDELKLEDFEEDFFIFDCPGQIELFLHSEILLKVVEKVKKFSKVALVYIFDSSNFLNSQKLLYSLLCSTITTYRFNLPVLNIISKADLLDEETLEKIISGEDLFDNSNDESCSVDGMKEDCECDDDSNCNCCHVDNKNSSGDMNNDDLENDSNCNCNNHIDKVNSKQINCSDLENDCNSSHSNKKENIKTINDIGQKMKNLKISGNKKMLNSMIEYVNNNGMMSFIPVNWKDDSSPETLLAHIDNILQRYDDEEPRDKDSNYD